MQVSVHYDFRGYFNQNLLDALCLSIIGNKNVQNTTVIGNSKHSAVS